MAVGTQIERPAPPPARSAPPGPSRISVLWRLPKLGRDLLGFMREMAAEYGDVVYFRFFGVPICFLYHPQHIEKILVASPHSFIKSKDYAAIGRALGKGLLTSEGEFWQRQRQLAQPAFHRERIAAYSELMVRYTGRMLDGWRDAETRDVHAEMMELTLEIVTKALFGAEIESEAREVGEVLHVAMERFMTQAGLMFITQIVIPTPSQRRFVQAFQRLDAIIYRIIAERRAATAEANDLISLLLRAEDAEGNRMSDQQLRDEAMTLFLAGHETTANALTWTWYLLAQNPEAGKALRAELDEVLAGRAPTIADLPRLRYTGQVVKEAMRLYPPAWAIGRESLHEVEVDGYRFPAGTNFFVSQWVTQHDPRWFPEPEEFRPERWTEGFEKSLPKFAYFPFGGGPRVCIGASFATMEATLVLATIAQRFELQLVPEQVIEPLASVTLRPRHGLRVTLHRRPA